MRGILSLWVKRKGKRNIDEDTIHTCPDCVQEFSRDLNVPDMVVTTSIPPGLVHIIVINEISKSHLNNILNEYNESD